MSIDALVANAGRLRILTALASTGSQEFVHLRSATKLTDGNLSSHARRLHSAGFIHIDKQFRAGKPVTRLALTTAGRTALEDHARELLAAIQPRSGANEALDKPSQPDHALREESEDWVD